MREAINKSEQPSSYHSALLQNCSALKHRYKKNLKMLRLPHAEF